MKKLIGTVMVAALVASAAFAEITFGAWLRALGAPVASDGKDTVVAMGNSWGYGTRTARLNVNATADDGNIGFSMGIYNDANMSLSAGDDARIWAKPAEMLTVSLGKYDNNTLRGDMCYGSWNWFRPTSSWYVEDEGLTMSGNGGTGMLLELTPVEGLYVQALIPMASTKTKADQTYKNLRGGFAYSIEGVGKLKAQYIGKGAGKTETAAVTAVKGYYLKADGSTDTWASGDKPADAVTVLQNPVVAAAASTDDGNSNCDIEVAFDLNSVENLFVTAGFAYYVRKDNPAAEQKMKIALGASYQVSEELKVSFSGAYGMFNKGKSDGGVDPIFQAGAGIDYNLGDGLALSADVRYKSKLNDGDKTDGLGFGVGLTKSISSNGYIGAAFQGQTNGGTWANNVVTGADAEKLTWVIPVAISCWF